jgi:putative ABC transport system permease protein
MAGIRLRAGGEKAGEGSTEGEGSAGGGQAGNVAATLAGIEKIWNTAYPNDVYSFAFLDDKIVGYYKEEGKVSLLYRLFAAMAILISCLGLYGLVSFMAVQRMKEIGVRKVLGASVLDVLLLLSGEMAVLLAGAFAVAAPVGYLLMHRWLEGFAYRITPGVGMFFGALAVSVVIALGTVGHRAFRAATANPARVLRSE